MAITVETEHQNGAESVENRISVRSLWKVFGEDPDRAMSSEYTGKQKSEIQEELGCVVALKDVSFDVNEGETFVVMGLSGSGKSTLVRCLTRLIEPNAGEIYVDAEDVIKYNGRELTNFRRTKTAMVFQHFGLMPNRTILDNVSFGLEIQGIDKHTRWEKAREVIELVGLKGWEDNYATELSGGMQQRVGLARALAVDPEILLMDEPFSALDPLIRREMQDELINLQTTLKKTIVFITHDLDEALRLGTRIAIMKDGEIVQLGSKEEIVDNPADSYVEDFIRSISRTRVLGAGSIMQDASIVVDSSTGIDSLLKKLDETEEDHVFVTSSDNRLIGMVSEKDLSSDSLDKNSSLKELITNDPPILNRVYQDTPIDELVPLSAMSDCPVAVVDEEDTLLGIVTRGSLLLSLAESQQAQINDSSS
ncbi:MAG: glycine betaine/L-proline ABC transporter ATP-binding protein [SAR202 cluster bacterium]|nr:glycine betaine/L-proline ABC transporter ATP-binding protein [SAR202 cluster bacterium]|tara:strand:+ start:6532 stop:7797 length:1266 start_codon:yes stop_codon:yes gene_type:complete